MGDGDIRISPVQFFRKDKMKYDEYDIQTACNIATGDDETTGKEVIRILKQFAKKDWEMMMKGIEKQKNDKV